MRNDQYKQYIQDLLSKVYPNEDPEKLWEDYLVMQKGFVVWSENSYPMDDNYTESYENIRGR